jgi:hypothetical protein
MFAASSATPASDQLKAFFSPKGHNRESFFPGRSAQVQPKLQVGPTNDKFEREADLVAESVVAQRDAGGTADHQTVPTLQAKCAACEEEVQRQPNPLAAQRPTAVDGILTTTGQSAPLNDQVRSASENVLQTDFSNVRVHSGPKVQRAAESINAKAFTHKNNIYLGHGASGSDLGLMAHELTHVVQQKASDSLPIQRTVSSASRCPGSVNGAPPAPDIFLTLTETLTSSALTLAMIGLTFDIQDLQAGRRPQNSNSFNAYLARFGPPEQLSNGRFRDRFSGSTSVSEDATIITELTTLKNRLQQIQNFFSNNIIYRCTSATARITVGTCTDRCHADDGDAFAWTCSNGAPRTIVICPEFWVMGASDASIGLIHEAAHLIFGFGDPAGSSMTTRRRARNPVCYSGFVASVSGRNPPDPDCPVVAPATAPVAPVAPVAPPTPTPTP